MLLLFLKCFAFFIECDCLSEHVLPAARAYLRLDLKQLAHSCNQHVLRSQGDGSVAVVIRRSVVGVIDGQVILLLLQEKWTFIQIAIIS
jgi:hypothetical protein